MKIYGLIHWGHKPSDTYLVSVSTTKEDYLDYLRQNFIDYWADDPEFDAEDLNYDSLEEWAYEHNYILDFVHEGVDI